MVAAACVAAASSFSLGEYSENAIQPVKMHRILAPLRAASKPDQVEANESKKTALAADGRWTGEELGMPIAGDRARLVDGGAGLDLNHDNDGGRNRQRRGAVQQDAERTVVGIGVQRMHMRNLDDGKQRQKEEAHHGDHRQSARPCAAIPAEKCLQTCQICDPCLKDTQSWMRTRGRGLRQLCSFWTQRNGKRERSRFV